MNKLEQFKKTKESADRFLLMIDSEAGQRREIWGGSIVRTLRKRIADLEEANARHTMNAIMRICPDCGEDMGGPDHKTCWKCLYYSHEDPTEGSGT